MWISSGVLWRSSLPVCLVLAACGAQRGGEKLATPAGSGGSMYATSSVADMQPVPERPGLGTSFGGQVYAPMSFAPFERAASSPWADVALHYNDAAGVDAH